MCICGSREAGESSEEPGPAGFLPLGEGEWLQGNYSPKPPVPSPAQGILLPLVLQSLNLFE